MGKLIFLCVLVLGVYGSEGLEKNCLSCHRAQQVPSELIYRRYLMRYSTKEAMEKAIFAYVKNPTKQSSIMPLQFFLKFPMKEENSLENKVLKSMIKGYVEHFDIKKKLMLKP